MMFLKLELHRHAPPINQPTNRIAAAPCFGKVLRHRTPELPVLTQLGIRHVVGEVEGAHLAQDGNVLLQGEWAILRGRNAVSEGVTWANWGLSGFLSMQHVRKSESGLKK